MLKILAGVMYPTQGQVTVRGSVAPLIELGAGFDMELTARENVYLNGAILGYDRAFMDTHMEQIISFSELESFVDVPLKNFSSGMVARLGFAIATVIRADILIVDEVLAVGDFKFQEKCKEKIAELLSGGATLLFVSHSIEQVKELCTKAVWLDHGELKAFGDTQSVCAQYMSHYGG
jgi:ABC-type polysaccharide/polyol phosphate transport system ATPase subunit